MPLVWENYSKYYGRVHKVYGGNVSLGLEIPGHPTLCWSIDIFWEDVTYVGVPIHVLGFPLQQSPSS